MCHPCAFPRMIGLVPQLWGCYWQKPSAEERGFCPKPHLSLGVTYIQGQGTKPSALPQFGTTLKDQPASELPGSAEAFDGTVSQQRASPLPSPGSSFSSPWVWILRLLPSKFPAPRSLLPREGDCRSHAGSLQSQATDWRWEVITLSSF